MQKFGDVDAGRALSLSFPWGYQLAIGRFCFATGGGKWRNRGYLLPWLVMLEDSVFGFRSSKCSWVRLGQPVRDAACSSWRVDRHQRYVREKGIFSRSILNSLAVGWCAYRVPVLREFPQRHCSTQCRDEEDGAGWRLQDLNGFLFIYLFILCWVHDCM